MNGLAQYSFNNPQWQGISNPGADTSMFNPDMYQNAVPTIPSDTSLFNNGKHYTGIGKTSLAKPSSFGFNPETFGAAAQGLNGLAGLAGAYLGYKSYGLAKDQFGFEKALANANYSNQAKLANNEIQNSGEVGMGLAGGTMDANARAARQAQLNSMKLSTGPIG